jgi:hypothetical protein
MKPIARFLCNLRQENNIVHIKKFVMKKVDNTTVVVRKLELLLLSNIAWTT